MGHLHAFEGALHSCAREATLASPRLKPTPVPSGKEGPRQVLGSTTDLDREKGATPRSTDIPFTGAAPRPTLRGRPSLICLHAASSRSQAGLRRRLAHPAVQNREAAARRCSVKEVRKGSAQPRGCLSLAGFLAQISSVVAARRLGVSASFPVLHGYPSYADCRLAVPWCPPYRLR